MTERDIGAEILEGIQEIKAFKAGKVKLKTRELKEPAPPQAIRGTLSCHSRRLPG
ncbi:MAG TPA: hypothetical protein PLS79_18360 [Caldilinea sp.]|nr:hypothetical protein [Caldilinea sp.]